MPEDVLDDETETGDSHDIRELRRKAKEADQLQARLATLERENAFAKAGVAVDDPKYKYFVKAYDGELSADAIKAELETIGLAGQPPARKETSGPSADEIAAYERRSAGVAGAGAPKEMDWQDALAEAGRIPNEDERTEAILDVVERFGGRTSRQAQ